MTSNTKKLNILISAPFTTEQINQLRTIAPTSTFTIVPADNISDTDIQQADIIMGNPNPDSLKYANHLQWLQLSSAGADAYMSNGVTPKSAFLTNSVGAYGTAVAEHTFAMTLSTVRKLPEYRDNQHHHLWKDAGSVIALKGARVLVLALGDIGKHYAHFMSALGAHVIGARRHSTQDLPTGVEKMITMDHLDSELSTADIVVSFMPGGDQTYHFIDQKFFDTMKKGAYFFNAGRGTVVDMVALEQSINSGHIAGAGLDVTEPEPLPQDSALWDMKQVTITPHVAGGFHHPGVENEVFSIARDNLKHFITEEPLKNIVEHS